MAAETLQDQIVKYLTDIHGSEENAVTQLKAGAEASKDPDLTRVLEDHLAETEQHEQLIRARLDALDASPSTIKDVAQKGLAGAAGLLQGLAPDTTGKIAIGAYTTEHFEIASYRLLHAVADKAGDQETAALAERILKEEQATAEKLDGLLEQAGLVGEPHIDA